MEQKFTDEFYCLYVGLAEGEIQVEEYSENLSVKWTKIGFKRLVKKIYIKIKMQDKRSQEGKDIDCNLLCSPRAMQRALGLI